MEKIKLEIDDELNEKIADVIKKSKYAHNEKIKDVVSDEAGKEET